MAQKDLIDVQKAAKRSQREFFRFGMGLLFVVAIMIYTSLGLGSTGAPGIMVVIAAMIGGYMAMNIGANDVANNVGPAVGSRSITMGGAILIAAIFEMLGALIAGGEVVSTIRGNIIDPTAIPSPDHFVWLMTASLLAGALWLNFATAVGAPVSTTHSIVGAVLGAGIAAGGMSSANWPMVGNIVASWVISPAMGGAIAAAFLFWIKRAITYKPDMVAAAQGTVPILIGIMAFAFISYMILKGFGKIWPMSFTTVLLLGLAGGAIVWVLMRIWLKRHGSALQNTKMSINSLFTAPLIFAAALLSFAHGSNDVANAIGPLAAITDTVMHGGTTASASVPLWVMIIGAVGIAIGLALYGPKLIRTVGGEITDLDQMRAFCIAMSATLTVIVASQLGLPVSSTHIAIGGVFGVGFLREHLKNRYDKMIEEIKLHHIGSEQAVVEKFLHEFSAADPKAKQAMFEQLKEKAVDLHLTKKEYKKVRKAFKSELVQRSALKKIVLAWIITVPASGLMAAFIYTVIVRIAQ